MAASALQGKEIEVTPEMIGAAARMLADRFESLPSEASAREFAQDLLRMALDAKRESRAKNLEAVRASRKTDAQTFRICAEL